MWLLMFKACCIFLSCCFFATSVAAHQQDCEMTLVVSTALEWPPYSWEVDGQYHGIDIQILEYLFSKLNYCWQYVAYPSSTRAFREFQKGNADVIFAASLTNERRRYAVFSEPYRQEDMHLIYHINDSDVAPYSENSTIVVNRGSYYGEAFALFKQQCPACVIELSLAFDRLKMVDLGRIQYAVEDMHAAEYLMITSDIHNIAIAEQSIHKNDVHFMFRPGVLTEQELKTFNETIVVNQSVIDAIDNDFVRDMMSQ